MSWSALANNQWISRNDLQDAVNTGNFTLKPSQTIPAGNNWVTRSEVETWTNAIVTSGAANQWPQKSWLITTTSTTSTTTTTVAPGYAIKGTNNNSTSSRLTIVDLLNGSTLLAEITFPTDVTAGTSQTVSNITPTQTGINNIKVSVGGANGLTYNISIKLNGTQIYPPTNFTMVGSPMIYTASISAISLNTGDILEVIYAGQ